MVPYAAQTWDPTAAQHSPVWMLQCVYVDWGQSVEGSAVCNSSGTAAAATREVLRTEV